MEENLNALRQTRNCSQCNAPAESEYETSLCSACRRKLSRRPIPLWINCSACIVLGLLVYSAVKVPQSLQDIARYERAQNSMSKEPQVALEIFKELSHRYPKSAELNGWYGSVSFHAGEPQPLSNFFNRFRGEKVSPELTREINRIISKLEEEQEEK